MTHAAPPRLYLVTDRHATGGRPLADVVATALRGGPAGDIAVQLREKDLGAAALLPLALALREVTIRAGARLFVNDRVDVALACGADGVHLGGGSLTPADVRALAPGLALASSAHAPGDLAAVFGLVDFAVFGPVFDTPSKRAFGPAQGLHKLAEGARAGVPILALGGVNLHNGKACLDAGAQGLACIRAVMSAPDPEAVVRGFFSLFPG